ncbi:MAG: helix-turn-helix transcriptional regulator [Acidimicrobiales bacterium]
MTESALAILPARRQQLLLALKRSGEARAEDLAASLGVTVSAVRQQLDSLTAEDLVTHRVERAERGRPRHLYRLTRQAESLFPKAYGGLTNELLDYVADSDPELVEHLFERRRQRRTAGALARLAGQDFGARVGELARILDDDGYLADFEALPDGTWRITEHNCAVLDVAERYGYACSSEIAFLRDVLPDAKVERVSHMIAGAHSCAYLITPDRPG